MARPSKYDPKFNKQIFKLCLLGAKDKEIADFLEINVDTFQSWKKAFPELTDTLKKGKEYADQNVSKSLYKRANGFYFDEVTHEEITIKDGGVKVPARLTKTVRKFIIPDTTAQIFWLKNRRTDLWRDKQQVEHSLPEGQSFTIGGQTIQF